MKKSRRELSILPGANIGVRVIKRTRKDRKTGKIEEYYDINQALKSFKKEVKESGILLELKERTFFVPKSVKKRKQKERACFFQQLNSNELKF
ncbi:MAG: 30S ribosomal protein S21 [Pelagibacterales bacterium]|nr:30S ribosomal protein S21 [Pelagibacterales bacterium]